MRRYVYTGLSLLVASVLLFAMGCGQKAIQKESELDTPQYHFRQGNRLLEQDNYSGARESFNRAKALNPNYGRAYSGHALVEAYLENYDEAMKLADQGVEKNDAKDAWTFVARGRVKMMAKPDNWEKKAEKDFEKAAELAPNDSEVYFWWGMKKKMAYQFRGAESMFTKVIENKDEWSKRADKQYAIVQKIVRAAPGTMVGKKIAVLEVIDRADLAVLFMEELKLQEVLQKKRPKEYDTGFSAPTDYNQVPGAPAPKGDQLPSDVQNHWAKSWIKQVIDLGIMETYPDGKWYPDENMTRGEYALFLQNIVIFAFDEPDLATKYIGENSRFKDMRSSLATYNAAALCVDRGIMTAYMDGTFKPEETVGGADALLIIRQLQNHLRMTF
ncbi:tetratricopeptide repeat protein [bacterium]|nr:tetratricopeptide repeat protein [bacterium]